jgi:hypothetical protein
MCGLLDNLTAEDLKIPTPQPIEDIGNYSVVFSCISTIEKNKLEKIVDITINNSPVYGDYKLFYKKEYKDFIIIGFSSELFDSNACLIRRLLFNLCNNLKVNSCSISTRKNDSWDVVIYLKEELSHDNWKSNSSFKECFVEDIETNRKFCDINYEFNIDFLKFKSIYHSGNLLIRNIDSDKVLLDEDILYIQDFVEKGLNNNTDLKFPLAYDNIFRMMYYPECNPSIPILLKKESLYYEELWKGIEGDIRNYRPKGKPLGYYTRMDEDFCKGPHIVISPENVDETAEKAGIPFRVLFTKVLVHEIAHAFMDKYREIENGILMYGNSSDNWAKTVEAKAMEESLANMITLAWFKKNAVYEEYKLVKHFINNWQNSIYRFGIWQERISADWIQWFNSSKQESQKLKEWFDLCFSSGNIRIPLSDYKNEMFNNIFV